MWNDWGVQISRDMPSFTNIALGASYTFDALPSYALCTDAGDATQLTDGVYTSGYFWTQSSTVGWTNDHPLMVLDLGSDQPIRGLSLNTAAGVAGVQWPTAILLLVAGNDQVFHMTGDLVTLDERHQYPPNNGYAIHRYWTDDLHTHGRYVAVTIQSSPYVFVDEIEVFEGESSWVNEPIAGQPTPNLEDGVRLMSTRAHVQRSLLHGMKTVLENAERLSVSSEVRNQIVCEWDMALAMFEGREFDPEYRAVLPFTSEHEKVFSTRAHLWRLQGHRELIVWQTPPWDYVPLWSDPPDDRSASITVSMMRNEYRAQQISVANSSPWPKTVRLSIEGLPGGTNPSYVTVHEGEWTGTMEVEPVSAALPHAKVDGEKYAISVPSGFTRHVWFTFNPIDVAAGEYEGVIVLDDGAEQVEMPLFFHLYPFDMPDRHRLHLGGWDYTNSIPGHGLTEENLDLFLFQAREHFVDRPWATNWAIPSGQYDANGNLQSDPSTSNFDAWLDLWPNVDRYDVFASVGDTFAGFALGSVAFDTAVGEWASFWSNHAEGRGLGPSQLAFLLVDEPHEPSQDATILAWANAIHASGSNILVWEDPTHSDIGAASTQMLESCDVLCALRSHFLANSESYQQPFIDHVAAGKTLEFYSCSGPSRLLDPYAYHRLQAWLAWQYGGSAMYYWALGSNGGWSSWNEFGLRGNRTYTPFFVDDTSVTTGKHAEAIREGIEDYEYLFMLTLAIADAPAAGVDPMVVSQAQTLLDTVATRVHPATLTSIMWSDALDRTVADQARVDILNALVSLRP